MYLRYTTEAGECVLLSASLFYKLLKTSPLAGRFFFLSAEFRYSSLSSLIRHQNC